MDYNTNRPHLIIPEYGRNIQKMVEYAITIENRDERNKIAQAIISVMGQLNPHLRDIVDFKHKLWDHLFIISGFRLDVDSPYPRPNKETIYKKPDPMDYPQSKIRYKHYGKTIELLINKAASMEKNEEQETLIKVIANLMKKSYLTWNRESVDDRLIINDLKNLSKGEIQLDEDFQLDLTNEILAKNKKRNTNKGGKSGGKSKSYKQNQKKRRY